MDWLESAGVVAGALVGLDSISADFADPRFSDRVAVTTGVVLPQLRKILLDDLEAYLNNLASTALGSVITLGPNESKDGYIFFPRGPIFGYGVDEFSVNRPSFIVNIDNEDVAVDGALVDKEFTLLGGLQSTDAQIETARNRGRSRSEEREKELVNLHMKLRQYALEVLIADVNGMIEEGDPAACDRLRRFRWRYSDDGDPGGILEGLAAKAECAGTGNADENDGKGSGNDESTR